MGGHAFDVGHQRAHFPQVGFCHGHPLAGLSPHSGFLDFLILAKGSIQGEVEEKVGEVRMRQGDPVAARHLHHMQKALFEMNLKIGTWTVPVPCASSWQSWMGNVTQWNCGELRNPRCRAAKGTFLKSLEGDWQPTQLLILKQCHEPWGQNCRSIQD